MRTILTWTISLAVLAVVLPLPAAAQDACTVDFGTHVGSPACPYQWVGATTVLYDGSGNGLGFIGMTSQCRGEFGAGARMCTSQEILDSDTHNINAIPIDGCWVRPVFQFLMDGSQTVLDASGLSGSASSLQCGGWNTGSTGLPGPLGLTLQPDGTFVRRLCTEARPVACCKPTPVPAPTSSLSLPIGAMGLVGLSMTRGA